MAKITSFVKLLFVVAVCTVSCIQDVSAAPSPHQFVADVNGDGKADAITFDSHTGDWWVAISSGSNFENPSRWITGFGVGSSKQFLADVNGDGKPDLVTYDQTSGDWWVAVSNGINKFETPSLWMRGFGIGSKNQLLGDVTGDGKADAVAFFDNGPGWCSGTGWCSGAWWVATSNISGNQFDPPGIWVSGGHGVGSTNQYLADMDGNGKADAVVFFTKTGDWWVGKSDGTHFSGTPHHWGTGQEINSTWLALGNANGDPYADIFTSYMPSGSGTAYAPSDGNGFNLPDSIVYPIGYGASTELLGDTYGSGIDWPISFDNKTGDWWVSGDRWTTDPNDNPYHITGAVPNIGRWISGFGVGTN